MRTPKQIKKEIETLLDLKPKVPQFSMFGDDNHEKIDAIIAVLEEDLDQDEIWERWPEEEKDMEMRMTAEHAMNWMNEEEDEAPSARWRVLAKRKKPS